jgi:DNA-binding beta-propeller fold protein YncE
VVIDGKTNKVIKSIPTGTPATPDDCYETFTCTDYGSDTYYVVVNEKTNKIYAGNLFDGTLLVIDGKTDKVIGSPISTGDSLSGLAVNHEINTVYAGDYTTDNLYVIDGKSDKIIGSPILIGTPATPLGCKLSLFNCVDYGSGPESIDVNEKTNRIYVSEDVGAVAVLDAKTHHKISEIHLGHGGK